MPTLQICRICLRSNVKLFEYDRFQLRKYYEQIMALKVNEKDSLPRHFCYECAALLNKFHKFKEKCYIGQNILREAMLKGSLSLKSIRTIAQQNNILHSILSVITVNHRVKTYTVKAKENQNIYPNDESFEIDEEVASAGDGDDNYVDNYQDEDELPLLPEIVDVDTKVVDEDENIDIVEDKIDILEEKIDIVEEKIDIVDENNYVHDEKRAVEEEKVTSTINMDDEIQETFSNHEKSVSEDEVMFIDDFKVSAEEKHIEKEPELLVETNKKPSKSTTKKKKINDDEKTKEKAKKFEINKDKKTTELDPKNWLKFNLTEEEAVEEFKARARLDRYLSSKYQCTDCLKGFSEEDILNRHVKLRHSESVGPLVCRFCRMRFKQKYYLTKHMRQHYTKFKCLRCELVCPLETTAVFHEDYHNGVIRKCPHCGQEFKHLSTYYSHLRRHRSEHVCTLCGASFVSPAGLSIHKKIKHPDAQSSVSEGTQPEEAYCKRCDIKFETKQAYEKHLGHSAMHVDDFQDGELKTKLGLKRRHRKDMKRSVTRIPTDCYVCGKHFSTQMACRRHHLAEHPQFSVSPPSERQICEICGISLKPASVKSHLNTHTRETLYTCDTCGREFSSKIGLIKHQLTHSDVKPEACTLCDKRFKQSSSLQLHYRTFHLKEPYPKRNRKKKIDAMSKLDEFEKQVFSNPVKR